MKNRDPDHDVFKIDLMSKPKVRSSDSTVLRLASPAESSPSAGMTMEELKKSYETILKARAIFHPVTYQFPRELGRGQQGTVFLALRQGARRCITEHAIKIFDPQIYRTPEEYWTDMGRIASQISKLQRVQNPNLVSEHSYDETHGIGYVQMEAIDGIDLRLFLTKQHLEIARKNCTHNEWSNFGKTVFRFERDRTCLQPDIVVYLLRRILRGLERLHEMNYLHCDIKPANIMINRLGHVKVVDFGRAAIAGEKQTFLLGSPMYMAPEIHRREVDGIQSDFYGVGLVGLEMLRGEQITSAADVTEKELLKIKMELPNRINDLLPGHVLKNEYLVSILQRFLDLDPEKRHSSAKDTDVGTEGLGAVDKQLVQEGVDTEHARNISYYLSKLVDPRTDRIEYGTEEAEISSVHP